VRAIAVNGSPRKNWNTAILLENVMAGAASAGVETEIIHLYDHAYQGCRSCFACKLIGGKSYGRCAAQDGLTSILERIASCDVLVLGSPVYLDTETGEMRSFMERLLFPYMTYTPGYASIALKRIQTALVYTMNINEEELRSSTPGALIPESKRLMICVFGACEVLCCTDTLQFDDYSRYVSSVWDAEAKARRRQTVFPQDCARAYELGVRLAARAGEAEPPASRQ